MKSMLSPFVGALLVVIRCTPAHKYSTVWAASGTMNLTKVNRSSIKLLTSGVPRIIMQTSADKNDKQRLEPLWTTQNPDYQYHHLDDADAVNFLKAEYGPNYATAFNNVVPGAIKADFLRLAWIYKRGGFYIDMDKTAHKLDAFVDAADIVIPQSLTDSPKCMGHLYNAFIAAKPGSLFIKQALDEALVRASSNWKPWADLVKVCYAIAGPVLLGEKLCHNLPQPASPCEYSGGSVHGTGCRIQLNTRTSLNTGETIVIFGERELDLPVWTPWKNPEASLVVSDVNASRYINRHYWDECKANQIYKADLISH